MIQAARERNEPLLALAERHLSPQEFEAYVRAPISDAEREATLELVEWFCRRYPTPAERLAYVRRAYKRWSDRLREAQAPADV